MQASSINQNHRQQTKAKSLTFLEARGRVISTGFPLNKEAKYELL